MLMMKLMTMKIWFTLLFLQIQNPVRLANSIQHPKWQKTMNEELMAIEKKNIMTQIGFNLDIPIKIYVDNFSLSH